MCLLFAVLAINSTKLPRKISQAVSIHSAKTRPAHQPAKLQLFLVLATILLAPCLSLNALAQETSAREIAFPITLRWDRQKGVSRYRLQIAADERFQNVFVDRRVTGNRSVISELPAGYYYWRVAPAESQVGNFSRPIRFFISGGTVITVRLPNRATRATRSHLLPAVMSHNVWPRVR